MSRYRIAVIAICLNQPYWEYLSPMIASARKFLLQGHDVDFIAWTDMPKDTPIDARIIPTEPHQWPFPTLYRYHLFLREKELLEEYDYIFYCDADMRFVSRVGDEILGKDLTAAQHPMYALRREYIPPYEPNRKSVAYIPRVGRVVDESGKKRFEPLYFAGGFQGGKTENFISAMGTMSQMIDTDFTKNQYIPIWNDETIWNKYLLDHTPSTVLSPSYIYPDSLIKQYYRPLWGRNYVPKIVTLTKKFSLSKDGGTALQQTLGTL
jgi:hypothetical protein